jgi:hypothetical protein
VSKVLVQKQPVTRILTMPGKTLVLTTTQTKLLSVGRQGPIGPSGLASTQLVTGESISALRILRTNSVGRVVYADKDGTVEEAKNITGVSTSAAASGELVDIQFSGLLTDSGWNWDMSSNNALYLGSNGTILQGAPSGTVTYKIGHAVSPTRIFINLGELVIN